MLIFSVNVARPVPLNTPSVEATLAALEVEFDFEFDVPGEVLPEGLLFGEVLPEEPLLEGDVLLQDRVS